MKKHTLQNFAVGFTVTALLYTLTIQTILKVNADADMSTLKVSNMARVENAHTVLNARLERAVIELRTIADTSMVRSLAENNNLAHRLQVQNLFLSFAREQKIFNQIRYLDLNGQEVVRVDYTQKQNAFVIPEHELQNKADRYYFQTAKDLPEGDISISPLDLNIEHNEIERPYNPMIRFSMPIYNQRNEKRGVAIVNLFGQSIIDRYRQVMNSNTDNQTLLLDQDANWLVAPDPSKEWGFMFGQPRGFEKEHPDVWKEISQHLSGHYQNQEGLYTYTTVYPKNWAMRKDKTLDEALEDQRNHLNNQHYNWKIITFTPTDHLPSSALTSSPRVLAYYLLGLLALSILTGLISYFVATKQVLRRKLALINRQQQAVLNHLGEGVLVLNSDSVVIETNPEAERLLQRTRSEIVGHPAQTLFYREQDVHDADVDKQLQLLSLPKTGLTYRNENEIIVLKDQSKLVIGVVSAPLSFESEIVGAVVAFRDMTEIKAYQDQIYQLAYHDILTDLPNRRLLNDYIQKAYGMALRHQRKFGLIFIDLDKFKIVNDVYGHDAGDELLKWVAKKLKNAVRSVDTVSRLGGDEFVILLSELNSAENVVRIAKKIIAEIGREPAKIAGEMLDVNISLGMAVYPEHGESIATLMQSADYAMYMAKRSGTNLYCIFGADPKSIDEE